LYIASPCSWWCYLDPDRYCPARLQVNEAVGCCCRDIEQRRSSKLGAPAGGVSVAEKNCLLSPDRWQLVSWRATCARCVPFLPADRQRCCCQSCADDEMKVTGKGSSVLPCFASESSCVACTEKGIRIQTIGPTSVEWNSVQTPRQRRRCLTGLFLYPQEDYDRSPDDLRCHTLVQVFLYVTNELITERLHLFEATP
jgi:hypothetical protein